MRYSLLFFLLPNLCFAERSQVSSQVQYRSTSDGIYETSYLVEARNHRRHSLWPYPEEKDSAWDMGARAEAHFGGNVLGRYRGGAASLNVSRKFSPAFLMEASLGAHRLQDMSHHFDLLIGSFVIQSTRAQVWDASLAWSRDLIYRDLIQPGAVSEHLYSNDLALFVQGHLGAKWRSVGRGSHRKFSDGNSRQEADLGVYYGLTVYPWWIWAGVGGNTLRYSQSRTSYWSPERFYSYGPRLEIVTPSYKQWSAGVGYNYNRFREAQFAQGSGYYLTGFIQRGARDEAPVKLSYIRIESMQASSVWVGEEWTLHYQKSF